jgi:hypothetical protein
VSQATKIQPGTAGLPAGENPDDAPGPSNDGALIAE